MRDDGDFDQIDGRIAIRDSVRLKDNPKHPRFLPKLCFISKAIKDEIVAVFMRNSKFMIASIHDNIFFREFIASVANGPSTFASCISISSTASQTTTRMVVEFQLTQTWNW